jgi:hypothetical protein
VWSDTLLSAERAYYLRLFAWTGLSIVSATAILVMLAARRAQSALLNRFALQTVVWSIVIAALTFASWHGLDLRDVSGAARLERRVWLRIGLDVGLAAVGGTLVGVGSAGIRRPGLVGSGVAIAIQGLGLFLLDVQFATMVSR